MMAGTWAHAVYRGRETGRWGRGLVAPFGIAALMLAGLYAGPAGADGAETPPLEELISELAAEREVMSEVLRERKRLQADLEALRQRMEELEAETEERAQRIERLEAELDNRESE